MKNEEAQSIFELVDSVLARFAAAPRKPSETDEFSEAREPTRALIKMLAAAVTELQALLEKATRIAEAVEAAKQTAAKPNRQA